MPAARRGSALVAALGRQLLIAGAAAGGGSLPDHSWEHLPVAWHSALSTEDLSAAALANLSKYPLVTLEKTAGSAAYGWPHGLPLSCQRGTDLSACGCCEEDHMVRQARALKAVNPRVHVVAYMNSIISYPWYRAARKMVTNSSWWLRNVNGSLLNNIAENPVETWFAWDFSKKEVGDLWMEACLNMTKTGVIDGCFMDGCANANPHGNRLIVPGPLSLETRKAYAANKPAWMAQLQEQVPGILICGSGGGWVPGVKATQVQNWGTHSLDYAGLWIPMLQRAVAAGVIFEAHAACGSSDPADPYEQTKLAAFLIAAGNGSYYLCGGWGSSSVDWYPMYDLPLGKPLSDAKLGADGVWRRDFAAGTKVSFNTKTNNGSIQWASLKSDDSPRVKADDDAPGKGAAQHVKVLFLDDADIAGGVSGLHGDLELRMNPPAVADGFAIQPDRPWERLGEHGRLQHTRVSPGCIFTPIPATLCCRHRVVLEHCARPDQRDVSVANV